MAKLHSKYLTILNGIYMFTYAFQPIVNVESKTVFAYEALLRGKNNESPQDVFSQIPTADLPSFDQMTRLRAIEMAAYLNINCQLNLNFMAACLYESTTYLQETQDAFVKNKLSVHQLVIEILEDEIIHDHQSFAKFINKFRANGSKVAIDDFGAGYSGLNLLANFQPDILKLDRELINNIGSHGPRQAVIKAVLQISESLGIDVIAEGVETISEYQWLKKQGIYLFQGFLFAKPGFECLPAVFYP
jgi:EAL domain-containing protein (putative c-di-GMP-specific phosphodiesterase class I)